jgi:hypothetical protein
VVPNAGSCIGARTKPCRFRIVFSMDTKIAHYYWPETALLLYLIGLYYMEFEIWIYS